MLTTAIIWWPLRTVIMKQRVVISDIVLGTRSWSQDSSRTNFESLVLDLWVEPRYWSSSWCLGLGLGLGLAIEADVLVLVLVLLLRQMSWSWSWSWSCYWGRCLGLESNVFILVSFLRKRFLKFARLFWDFRMFNPTTWMQCIFTESLPYYVHLQLLYI